MGQFLIEYWEFIRSNKRYWLIPIILVFCSVGYLVVFSAGSAIAPFIYSFF